MLGGSLFGYGAPSGVAYVLTSGDAAFTSDVVLDNSAPADVTLMTWRSGTQTTSSAVTLQAQWSNALVPRCACLLGVDLPVGLPVTIKGKRAGDSSFSYGLGGNSQSTTVLQLDDGSRAIIWVFDTGLDPIIGYEMTMTNNIAGATAIVASQEIQLGEARIFQGYQPTRGIQEKWAPSFDNIQAPQSTVNRQPHVVNHRYNHNDSVTFGVTDETAAWYADAGQISLNRFAHIAATHQTLLAIPYAYRQGALVPQMLANSAIYGYASKIQRPQHVTNHYYQLAMDFTEYPPAQYG